MSAIAGPVTINLLGRVDVTGSDAPLSARALALTGYLVLHRDAAQPRGHLADVLWPDSDTAQARTNLRRELHHLRAVLGSTGCLESTDRTLTWRCVPGVEVDLARFTDGCVEALRALEDDTDGAPRLVQRALDAYGGDLLPGVYDDWVLEARARLHGACVELCDRGADHLHRRGLTQEALALLRHRTALEPLEEAGYRRLMALEQESGDRAGALRTYHRCASVLERELGVPPSTETRALLGGLLAERAAGHGTSPGPGSGTTTGPGSGTATGTGAGLDPSPRQLVGREEERARLRELWGSTPHSHALVLVTGEAGLGKTRLVEDLARTVRAEDGAVATARCFAATAGLPLAPVAEWLRNPHLRAAAARLEPVWRAEVERLVPESRGPGAALEGSRAKVDAWQRLRFFEGLARTVLTVDRPLLLVIDDLQWCDTASMTWLAFLVSAASSAPLLVVATARDEELPQARHGDALAELEATGRAVRIALQPLARGETGELAAALAPDPLTADELDLVHSVTAGNPFFVIEALRDRTDAAGPLGPAGLSGVLQRRLARLSEPGQQVLGLAAAVGRDFTLDLLAEACDLEPSQVVEAVDELWRRRVFEQHGQGYDFTHSLLREAAYDAMPPTRRWLAHRRLAQALELVYADRVDSVAGELAEQYDRSGRPERALPFYERAARQATAVFAHVDAVRLWRRCLALVAETPAGRARDERELATIEQLLPPLNAWRGYASRDLETYERRADELGRRLGLVPVQATASIALFATTFVQGHTVESHRWGARALELSDRSAEMVGQAHMAYGGSALSLGRTEEAAQHLHRAWELAGESDSLPIGTRLAVHAQGWEAHARWLLGDEQGARDAATESLSVAAHVAHPYSTAVGLSYAAVTQQLCGDLEALATTLAELTAVCERYEFAYYREWATVLSGWLRGGSAGIEQARRGIELLEREGSLARMPYWLWLLADLERASGATSSALALLDAAHVVATQNSDVWWLPEVLRVRAGLQPASRARQDLERALALATEHGSPVLQLRARRALGD